MATAAVRPASFSTTGFEDGLGRRSLQFDRGDGRLLERLVLRPELRAFEAPLRERLERWNAAPPERFATVRAIERDPVTHGLTVLSDLPDGTRMSDLLELAAGAIPGDTTPPTIDVAIGFLLQAIPALSVLHAASAFVHGAVGPGHVFVAFDGHVVFTDGLYAQVLERLQLSRRRLWTDLRVAMPPSAGVERFDTSSDLAQVSMIAVSLALGRPLSDEEYPDGLVRIVEEVTDIAQIRGSAPFAARVRRFLARTLPLADTRRYARCDDALIELTDLARSEMGPQRCRLALASFIRELLYTSPAQASPDPEPVGPPHAEPLVVPHVDAGPQPTAGPCPAQNIVSEPPRSEVPSHMRVSGPHAQQHTAVDEPATQVHSGSDPESAVLQVHVGSDPDPAVLHVHVAPDPEPVVLPVHVGSDPEPVGPEPVDASESEPLAVPMAAAMPLPPKPPPVAPPSALEVTPVRMPIYRAATGVLLPEPPKSITIAAVAASTIGVPAAPVPPADTPPVATIPVRRDGLLFAQLETRSPRVEEDFSAGGTQGAEPAPSRGRSPWWKVAAAAVLVLLAGLAGTRGYIPERASAAAAPVVRLINPTVVPPAPPTTGSLVLTSQPAGAKVSLDGEAAGETPLTLDTVAPGRHVLTFTTASASLSRTVRIKAGESTSVDVPVFSGWLSVFSPITLDVSENGRAFGSSENDRLMLPPGRHMLTLRNRTLGYSTVETVEIVPGEEERLTISPRGTLNVNAVPWAEVWIDGEKAGDTPLANVQVSLGTREVVFRHPELGERRVTVTVSAGTPAVVSVDLSKS